MQEHDKKAFAELMVGLGEYYSVEVSRQKMLMYWQGLSCYDLPDVQRAFAQHMRNPGNGRFFPKIADVAEILDGGSKDRAAVAWSKVHNAVRTIGPYQSVVFDDPLIHCVLRDMGGWIALCDVASDKMGYRQNEFERRYAGYATSGILPDDVPNRMIGEAEGENRARGLLTHIPKPILVGDMEKARQVQALPDPRDRRESVGIGAAIKAALPSAA